ncbi:hypothetical protein ABPG74_019146 [Tetrahymena malaccensis]
MVQDNISSPSNLQSSTTSLNFSSQIDNMTKEISIDQNSLSINSLHQTQVPQPSDEQNYNYTNHSQKQPINNGIFDEDSYIENSFYDYNQFINYENLARKQFVCYLILRLFESDQLCTFPSFYEIWNKCFPEEIQTKKKLSKFDKKEQNQKYKRSYKRRRTQKDSIPNSENDLNNPKSKTDLNLEILQQEPSSPSQNIQDCNLFYKSQVTLSENTIAFISQKQPINNKIFEEEEENKRENEEEYVINHNKNYSNSEENFNIQIQYQYDQQNLFIYEKQQYQMYNQEQYQLQQQLKREEEYYYSPEIFSNEQFFIHSQKNFCENAQQINSDGYYNFQTQYQI